jgi:N-acylneuraminate cytidylyltransferase/CMP-N,N'-diacetyllegionaminic acid synthase
MFRDKTFLAIIPARSGSKGLTDKNIRELNHKPLMAYTIEACTKAGIFDEVVVSTDSDKYAKIAQEYGARVPFLRPKELATDEVATNDVILHVIRQMHLMGKDFDYFMLLQPTSPLRNEKHILESARILLEGNADSVISICNVESPRSYRVQLTDTGELKTAFLNGKQMRRQDMKPEYKINGAIYLVDIRFFLAQRSFYTGRVLPIFMDVTASIDIDEEFQFQLAEFFMTNG